MRPKDERALMLAIVSIGAKIVALEADPRIWKTADQLALCRDLFALQQCISEKETMHANNEKYKERRKKKRE